MRIISRYWTNRQRVWSLALLLSLLCASPVQAQYTQSHGVFSAGGGFSQSDAYQNIGTLGQASPLGRSSQQLAVNYGGFWGGGISGAAYTLTVQKGGDGQGTVTGGGITCGLSCLTQSLSCEEHTTVVLEAQEAPDSTFVEWLMDGQQVTGEILVDHDLIVTAVFAKKPDTDNDGLADDWEQQIIAADPDDGITTIEDVLSGDDFDGDGLTNEEEFWNQVDPTTPTEVFADITPMNAAGTEAITEAQQLQSFRMHLQLRIRESMQPVSHFRSRDVTVLATGGGRFDEGQVHAGSTFQSSVFPGRVYARTDTHGQFAIDIKGIEEGRVAFQVEQFSGGGGVIPPASPVIALVHAPFLTAVWDGRRLQFAQGADRRQLRIADLAAAMYNFSGSAGADWTIGGKTFQDVTISKQGWLFLGQEAELPATSFDWQNAPDGLLAPLWDRLVWKEESRIYVNWDWLTEPYVTVEWSRMGHVSDPEATLTFQVQLWQRSGQVRFAYYSLLDSNGQPLDWSSAAVGMNYGAGKKYTWTQPLHGYSALEVVDAAASAVNVWGRDSDQDRLYKEEEEALGTDPMNWDSDFDLMSDGWEVTFRPAQSPLVADAFDDADGDGYLNIIEYYHGSKPNRVSSIPTYTETGAVDSDLDGMPDSWETQYGLDPNSADDAIEDADGDSYRNVLEYVIGGDPTDANDHGAHPYEPNGGANDETY